MSRKSAPLPAPAALACGLMEDGNRALFLCRKNNLGVETVELPCVLLFKGENQIARITDEFRRQTGIDAQAHEILFERHHNAGSRKRKRFIPVLVFKMTAKSTQAKPPPEFSGYKWLEKEGLAKQKRARNLLWL